MSESVSVARPVLPGFDPKIQPWSVDAQGLLPVASDLLTPEAVVRRFAQPPRWAPEFGDEQRFSRGNHREPVGAAVLVPLITRPDGLSVLFTQRTAHLHNHGGQISFPGGRAEPEDATPVDTALRETEEETGVHRNQVQVLGTLPDYLTATGFRVTPVVGLTEPDFTLACDPFEVAEVFEVPLTFLMDPHNHRLHTAQVADGVPRRFYSIPFRDRFIWGATAGMLRNLYHFLRA